MSPTSYQTAPSRIRINTIPYFCNSKHCPEKLNSSICIRPANFSCTGDNWHLSMIPRRRQKLPPAPLSRSPRCPLKRERDRNPKCFAFADRHRRRDEPGTVWSEYRFGGFESGLISQVGRNDFAQSIQLLRARDLRLKLPAPHQVIE
jgi:hypothetical protein